MESNQPFVVCQARYSGTYEGGEWLAFPCHQWNMGQWGGAFADDTTCSNFWNSPQADCIGRGDTPEEAVWDMERRNPVHDRPWREPAKNPVDIEKFNKFMMEFYGPHIREELNRPIPWLAIDE